MQNGQSGIKPLQGTNDGSKEITRRRFLAKGASFAMAAAVTGPGLTILSGCGGGGGASSGPMTLWSFVGPEGNNPTAGEWVVDTVEAWNEEHEVQIERQFIPIQEYIGGQRLQTAFASGEGPDIFIVSPGDILRYINGEALQDLAPFMEQEAIDDFYPERMAALTAGERIYGIPYDTLAPAVFYSVEAFEEAGLSEADLPTNWEQFLQVGSRVQTQDRFGLVFETAPGYLQNSIWYPFMWMGGGEAVTDGGQDSNFDSAGTVQALRLYQEFIESGVASREALGSDGTAIIPNLASGYCAMQLAPTPAISGLERDASGFEYGVFRYPVPDGGEYSTAYGGWAFAANSQGVNPEEAARFCAWSVGSMSEDSIGRVRRWVTEANSLLSPRRSVDERITDQGFYGTEQMRTFRDEIFPGGRSEPRFPPEINQAVSDALQACMLDGADPSQQAEQANEDIESFLQGYSGVEIV